MTSIARSLVLLPALLCASCELYLLQLGGDDPDPEHGDGDGVFAQTEPLDVTSARLEGDMGSVVGYSADARSIQATGNTLALQAGGGTTQAGAASGVVEEPWAVMMALTVRGAPLDDPALEPGAHLEPGAVVAGRPVALSVLGCSGPASGTWTFDQTTTNVAIDVEEGTAPDTRRADVSARWPDGTVSRASFEYRVAAQ